MESMQGTPRGNRLHIGIFGRTNSGKSSLLNALIRQDFAVVSEYAGTTTDPVFKSMEIHGIGPVTFIDTAGFSDTTALGKARAEKTEDALQKTDVAVVVFAPENRADGFAAEKEWMEKLRRRKTPAVPVLNKTDAVSCVPELLEAAARAAGEMPVAVSALQGTGIPEILTQIRRKIPEDSGAVFLTAGLCSPGDAVLLVMPQDIQAPKGRLILPQVQVIRELLDRGCIIHCCTPDVLTRTLDTLAEPPALIITDSQVFKTVYDKKPEASRLTSFSVLLAAEKGNISRFAEGADGIGRLRGDSKVLIAEACAHAPLTEDIGREKIPAMLRQFLNRKYPGEGDRLQIEVVSGTDFPEDLSPYSLVIHCGACMFNRAYVLARQEAAAEAGVPMTNYGITIAWLNGILDKVTLPQKK